MVEAVEVKGRGCRCHLLRQKYCCFVLGTSCICFKSHFLSKLAETPSKSYILRILDANLIAFLFYPKSIKSSCFRDSDVTKTSLSNEVLLVLFVSMERIDSYLFSSTKIIKIGGIYRKKSREEL